MTETVVSFCTECNERTPHSVEDVEPPKDGYEFVLTECSACGFRDLLGWSR